MAAYKLANIFNPESVLSCIPLSNNAISSRIADIEDDVKSILIRDQRYSKLSLTVDESTFANHSVLLAFVSYIKDSRICEELLFMKSLINTAGEQVCNAVTEFIKTDEISIDSMISICTAMIGKKRISVQINWRQKRVYYSLCSTSLKFGIEILATVILVPFFKWLFYV